MRDSTGTYVGIHRCKYYQGINRIDDVECCGGRTVKKAFVSCVLKGVIEAEIFCSSSGCKDVERIPRK